MLNQVELNIILYYADFLSLKQLSTPVTDNCKYFFIRGVPTNAAFIVGLQPFYDENNPYFQQAYMEYNTLKDSQDEEAVQSFIEGLCNLKALGCVNAEDMLKCIHQFSNKAERKYAFKRYDRWKNSQVYTHITINDDDERIEQPCTRYVAHYEYKNNQEARIRYIERVSIISKVPESVKIDGRIAEEDIKESVV